MTRKSGVKEKKIDAGEQRTRSRAERSRGFVSAHRRRWRCQRGEGRERKHTRRKAKQATRRKKEIREGGNDLIERKRREFQSDRAMAL